MSACTNNSANTTRNETLPATDKKKYSQRLKITEVNVNCALCNEKRFNVKCTIIAVRFSLCIKNCMLEYIK